MPVWDTDQEWERFGQNDPYFGVLTDEVSHYDLSQIMQIVQGRYTNHSGHWGALPYFQKKLASGEEADRRA
jgi:hypothetical protein